jgi:peptide/nickel transport system permease protein
MRAGPAGGLRLEDLAGPAAGPRSAAAPVAPARAGAGRRRRFEAGVWLSAGWLGLVVVAASFAGELGLPNPARVFVAPPFSGPSLHHLLGTDDLGRDLASRLAYGARVSLVVGVASVGVSVLLGGAAGLAAGYRRGLPLRLADAAATVLLAFPPLVFLLGAVSFLGHTLAVITLAIGLLATPTMFRVVRAETAARSKREHVVAARLLGARGTVVVAREILPDVARPVLTVALLGVAFAILAEGSLAFLGLSVALPIPSWGNMIAEGLPLLARDPWISLLPSGAMFATVLALHTLADRLELARSRPVSALGPSGRQGASRPRSPLGAPRPAATGRPGGETAAGAAEPLLCVSSLSVAFRTPRGVLRALEDVSFEVAAGDTVGVVGESGSGKSVLARALLGLLPANAVVEGSARFRGLELVGAPARTLRAVRGSGIGLVLQDAANSLTPVRRIGSQLVEAQRAHRRVPRRVAARRAVELLGALGLADPKGCARRYPHELSGGMRQRATIAAALLASPELLLADEATTGLDPIVELELMGLLAREQAERSFTLVLVSHDLSLVGRFARSVVVLYAGSVLEAGPVEEVLGRPLVPYTKALLDAALGLGGGSRPLRAIEGAPPDPLEPLSGCPFAPRCPRADEGCARGRPPLRHAKGAHRFACWHPLEGR